MDTLNFITQLSIFDGLAPEVGQAITKHLEEKQLHAGETLFRQGDPGDAFYIITDGLLHVHLQQPDGIDTVINALGPGEYVGEMALLSGQPRNATLIAKQDTTLLYLTKTTFDRLVEAHPSLAHKLAAELLPRFQQNQANLALTRVFGQLDEAILDTLQEQLEWRHMECGESLCHQGELGNEMYIVVQGRLRLVLESAGKQRVLGEAGTGDVIGEYALFAESGTPESQRSATIYATRATDIIVLTRPVFERLVQQYPQILIKLTRRIIQRTLRVSQSVSPNLSAQVITVLPTHPAPTVSEFARQLADTFNNTLGPTLFLDPDRFEHLYGKPGMAQTPLDHPLSVLINTWLDERNRTHQYVIHAAPFPLDETRTLTPWAERSVKDADIILLVGLEDTDPTDTTVEDALAATQTRARRDLVLLHAPDCQTPTGTMAWLGPRRTGEFPIQAHYHVRQGHSADLRRLCRRISGHPVGLALSGGGACGLAHMGVIRALEEANVDIDWVGGSSMGAIIAAYYALDWPIKRMYQVADNFSDRKKLLDYTFPYVSLMATRRIKTLFQTWYAEADIEDTWRPYFCISTNLTRGEEQIHTRGRLWKAVRASMAFPTIFAPMLEDNCILIDGGVVNNLPIDHMRELCPTGTVIGVHMHTNSPTSEPYNFGPSLSGWRALLSRLLPLPHPVKAPTLFNIVAGIVDSNSRSRLNEVAHCADLLIQIPADDYSLLDFDQYKQIIELGYTAAKEQLANFKF